MDRSANQSINQLLTRRRAQYVVTRLATDWHTAADIDICDGLMELMNLELTLEGCER